MDVTTEIKRGFRYVYSGTLTGTVNSVAAAQKYLHEDEMVQYLEGLPTVIDLRWDLMDDGHHYEVVALSYSELNETEISDLTEFVRAQHSDGLGEGFEQQEFCWNESGEWIEEEGEGYTEGEMVSFDWKTNTSTFIQVPRF